MSEKLIQLNYFTQGENRVWFDASKGDVNFGYSDGQEIEQRLHEILTNANDLSHLSYELKSHIIDWPTEYHLSPVRSNLIRALNLSGVKRVLELGCGCGSITRYLGDYQHDDGSSLEVDSVEGSPVRAELAALRCRDLPNVNVSTANFNDIDFPEDYYDLVLYVGVTEYAGRFSNRETDEEALQDLLALAKRSTVASGVVMVAIENRTGFKYVEGANEDHYAKPYIGIHNYAQPAGIRTYTKKEWQQQIQTAGFAATEFIYPFPDYKIPTVFLGEKYVDDNPYCHNHLETCRSRDYIKNFDYASKESLFWESAAASKTLGDYANSFMLLMSNSQESVDNMSQNDFLHLPTYQRKLEFCMSIAKPKNKATIVRDYIVDQTELRQQSVPEVEHHRIDNEAFVPGPMLSVEWSRSLISYPDLVIFENYLREYFAFLAERQSTGKLSIDLLPINIMLTDSGKTYNVIDEEWHVAEDLTAEFVYFRAILFFYMSYPDFVEDNIISERDRQSYTLEDWIRYGFSVIDKDLSSEDLLAHANLNEQFQDNISNKPFAINFDTLLYKNAAMMTLKWKAHSQSDYNDKNSISLSGQGHYDRQSLCYSLPSSTRLLDSVQFFPCGEGVQLGYAFFRLYKLSLQAVSTVSKKTDTQASSANGTSEARILWELDNEQELAALADLHDMKFEHGDLGEGYYAHQYRPSMEWSLEGVEQKLTATENLQIVVEARFPITPVENKLFQRNKVVLTELEQIKASQSYALALKIADVVKRLRGIKAKIFSKKKELNNTTKKIFATKPVTSEQWFDAIGGIPASKPLISIIVPFRDEAVLLDSCIRSIITQTTYDNYEIVAVSNDSVQTDTRKVREQLSAEFPQCRFIDHNVTFNFSILVNEGVRAAQGEYIVLLNNDVEITSPDWLSNLLSIATVEKVAAVGGRLDFANKTIQHLGLHIAESQLPVHSFKHLPDHRLDTQYLQQPRYVSAVTGAMLMCSRKIWDELNGFEEDNFGVAFNDVDFCLRAIEKGYKNVLQPMAIGVHHESVSRGYETTVNKMRRFDSEQSTFIDRHQQYVQRSDPYFQGNE